MKTIYGLALAAAVGLLVANVARAEDEVGPHKGAVAEWGEEEYHLEIVTDAKTGEAKVYLYGSHDDLKKAKAKAIDSKTLTLTLKADPAITVKLEPKPTKDDPKGVSSVFVGKHDALKKDMKWTGSISGKVGTKPYTGDFKQK